MSRRLASRIRQLLLQTEQARERYVALVLGTGPLIEGAFVTRGRKCGKPNCRCAGGELHYSKFVSRSVHGRAKQVYVPAYDEGTVAAKTAVYKQVRSARAELMKLAVKTAELIDELVLALREPYGHEPSPPRSDSAEQR